MVLSLKLCRFSSFVRSDHYLGFAINLLFVLVSVGTCFVALITSGSFYMGLCSYINAMVLDMRSQMDRLTAIQPEQQLRYVHIWPVYVKEMQFHCQSIECVTISIE